MGGINYGSGQVHLHPLIRDEALIKLLLFLDLQCPSLFFPVVSLDKGVGIWNPRVMFFERRRALQVEAGGILVRLRQRQNLHLAKRLREERHVGRDCRSR